MLSECTYCSTPLNTTSEEQTILSCSFCGKVCSVEEERQTIILMRKLRGSRRQRGEEAECEQSCVTVADCVEDETELSYSDSTASSKVLDVEDVSDVSVRRSSKRK